MLTFGNSNLQLPSQFFYGTKVWRLARPLQDLNVLLLKPLCCCLGRVFWVLAHMFSIPLLASMPWLWRYMAPFHRLFDAVQLSCPLSRKNTPKHNVSTSMFDGGNGVLGDIDSITPPPNMTSWVDAKSLILVLSDSNTFTQFSSESLENFRWACTCAFLSRGPCGRCRISVLEWMNEWCIYIALFVYCCTPKALYSHVGEPGQFLDGRPPGKTRLLLEEVLVRPAGGAHPAVCVGPKAPV